MKIKIFQKGFNYSQDGQGNRLVYHLQGCNMRCPWCSNPEGLALSNSSCTEVEIDEILDEARRSTPLFFEGGGVTLTGGEATLQFDPVRTLFTKLKEAGIHTALETNGTHERLAELFPLIDELIIDLKHYDNAIQEAHTKIGNTVTLSNIQKALASRKQLLIRIPLVSGFNADLADIPGFIQLIKSFDSPELPVELLTYHEFGRDKWTKHGIEYQMENGYVPTAILQEFQRKFHESEINLITT